MINDHSVLHLFRALPLPTVILEPNNLNFAVAAVNEAYLKVTGNSENELIGKDIFRSYPYNNAEIPAAEIIALRDSLQQSAATGKIQKPGILKFNNDSVVCYFQPEITPVSDDSGKLEFIILTLTEQRAFEKDLTLLMDNMEESFIQVNRDLHIINYNNQFSKLFRMSFQKDVYKGDSILNYALPGHEAMVKNIYARVFEGETIDSDIEVPSRHDKEVITYRVHYKPAYDKDGTIQSAFVTTKDITDEKRAKDMLLANEKRYRALVENSSDGVIILTAEGTVTYASPTAFRLMGYSEKDIFGLNIFSVIHEEDIQAAQNIQETSRQNPGVPVRVFSRLLHKNGTWRYYERTLTNMLHEPAIGGIVDNFHDITDRVEIEKNLLISRDNFQSLVQSIDGIIWECNADTFQFTYVSPQSERILGYPPSSWYDNSFWVDHIHPEDRDKTVNYYMNEVSKHRGHTFKYRMIAANGETVWFRDSVTVIEEAGKPSLLRGLMVDITEIKKAEAAKEFERRDKEALINSTEDLIWSISKDLKLVAANEAFINNLRDITGKIFSQGDDVLAREFFPEEFCDYWNKLYKKALKGNAFVLETHAPEFDGDIIWYETSFNPIYKEDKSIAGIACFSRNITEKKRSQQELIQTNEKLKIAQHLAKVGYWETDLKTQKLFWSAEVYAIWGVDPDTYEVNFDNFYKTIYPDDRDAFTANRETALKNGEPFNFEHRILLADGTIKWVHENGDPIMHNGIVTGIQGTVQDITESKLAETALKQSNERFQYATRATSDAIWDWDLITDIIYWGEGFETIFGHKLSTLQPDKSSWINYIHPDDRSNVIAGIYKVIEGNQNNWSDEYWFLKSDGQYSYVHDKGIVIRDEKGKAVRMIGAMHDLTKQKEEENRLRLLESVITNANDAVMITEAEPIDEPGPKIVFINEAFSKMTGYSREEIIGKSPRILQGPKTDRKELDRMRQSMEKWQPCQIEIVNYKKSGEEFWLNIAIVPVADQTGWFTHWISIERDVTERRNYVEMLEKRNKALTEIAWTQSHVVRAPLARLMGLIHVIEIYPKDELDQSELLDQIMKSAEELDEIIQAIIKKAGKIEFSN